MSALPARPLGAAIPDSPHAVSVSLPTMRAVRGYEEKDPAITQCLQAGYPRFVVHPFARELAAHLGPRFPGRRLWLTSSAAMAGQVAAHLQGLGDKGAEPFADLDLHGIVQTDRPEFATQAKLFLQHVGGFLASREAEDQLIRRGLRATRHPEPVFAGDGAAEIRRQLERAFPGAGPGDLLLTSSGMNAIYAAYRAIAEVQARRGRTEWVQLGWLYLDSIAILKKFSGDGGYHHVTDVFDLDAVERLFAARGAEIAGLMAEVPSNPLIQTTDVVRLADLCRRHGVLLLLDPSVASSYNVEALPHADLVVTSLTKYTASEGDVLAGAVVVNPAGAQAPELRRRLPGLIEPLYARDLGRLAAEIGATSRVLEAINGTTPAVAAFLERHPAVAETHWALSPASADHFRRVLHRGAGSGGMISFVLKGDLAAFYDRLALAKGPSFGMTTTLICPFMYLAHYDLVTSEAGRAELTANRLSPDLLRLCVGTEPAAEIIAALAAALQP